MKLKKKIKSLDEVPEAARSMYVKKGDEYVLDVEVDDDGGGSGGGGDAAKELADVRLKLKEFRDNNIALQDQLKKFKDIDPEKYAEARQALEAVNKLEEAELIKSGKLDEVVERRLGAYKKQVDKDKTDSTQRIQALEKEAGEYKSKYSGLLIDTRISELVAGVGQLRKGALADVLNRARSTWKVNDKGELVAEGQYDTEGKPLTPEGYVKGLLQDAPYLFEPGQGGGAGGGQKKQGRPENGPRVVENDPIAIGKNMEAIAKGEAIVRGHEPAAAGT